MNAMALDKLKAVSDSLDEKQSSWVTAKELSGKAGMPTTDRRTRDILDGLADGKDWAKRKRAGTKAFEYHISILPKHFRFWFEEHLDESPEHDVDKNVRSLNDTEYTNEDGIFIISNCLSDLDSNLDDIKTSVPVPISWLKKRGIEPENLAFYVQTGSSMSNKINQFDIVIVNTGDNRLVDGCIVAVLLDEYVVIRYVQKIPGGWALRCENSSYQPIKLPNGANYNYKILGHVVRIIHEV